MCVYQMNVMQFPHHHLHVYVINEGIAYALAMFKLKFLETLGYCKCPCHVI
jgi:hypothetical protein